MNEPIATIVAEVIRSPRPGKPNAVLVNVGRLDKPDTEGIPFEALMAAAEFLTHIVATESNAGYERALDLVREGAMTYRRPK